MSTPLEKRNCNLVKKSLFKPNFSHASSIKSNFLTGSSFCAPQSEIAKIEQARKEIKEGIKSLADFKEYREFEIDKQTVIPDLLTESGAQFSENPLIAEVLQKMSPGEIWPNIIADDYTYQIVRLLKEDEEKYYLDGVIVNKKSFDVWFRDYARRNIKVEIQDVNLRERIRQNYSNLWWVDLMQ